MRKDTLKPMCENYRKYVKDELFQTNKYEFYSYGHAIEILHDSFPDEWEELENCLINIKLTKADITKSGGNKSPIPKKFEEYLYPRDWQELKISGDLIVKTYPRKKKGSGKGSFSKKPEQEIKIEGFIDGHNIDFVKNKVAFDLEWNSKDQTFDRDLLAMRTYFDCGIIDVGVIVTRAEELNEVFKDLGILSKYGASTTWIGKLNPRLDSRRNGGCPILAIGIKKECVEGYERFRYYDTKLKEFYQK